jgi:antitoxin MazE
MKTVVQQWGNSLAVRIPKPVTDQVRLKRGTNVEVVASNGEVIVRPAERRRKLRLEDLLKRVTRKNIHLEIQTGPPRGREVW